MEKIDIGCSEVLSQYQLGSEVKFESFGTGLINHTWLVTSEDKRFILQKINRNVFKEPGNIAHNIELIDNYLKQHHPEYLFVAPLKTRDGSGMVHWGEEYYRLFPFVENSHSYDVVQAPQQAFEAAQQFGLFTTMLSGLSPTKLKLTLPAFHDLTGRYNQFEDACKHGLPDRIQQAQVEIDTARKNAFIVTTFEVLHSSGLLKTRVTHHDTKISNVLFDPNDKGICVIDLDTVMPGFFISDVGDMMRTYLSPVSEEEKDLSKIEVREEYFTAILEGYLSCMAIELSEEETRYFVYSGMFMIYMQAIRFLTDFLNNDQYYGASYEGHNLLRAQNQLTLLKCLQEKESALNHQVSEFIK
ncbi:MAG: phosphotransferase enzyme family protein [Flavisolibacter sp.]